MKITTWNVLHRVHAVNWKEAPVVAFPDERVRIAGITALVMEWLDAGADVICLQEVSGDQLTSIGVALAENLRPRAQIFDHVYPRLPAIRGGGPPVLDDATEHLVTIVAPPPSGRPAARVQSQTFDTDPGKGMLVTLSDGIRIVNTHVSFGPRSPAQLAAIQAATNEASGGAVVVGDFNAPADVVAAGLGASFTLSDLTGQAPTRIPTSEHAGRTIDHVAVRDGVIESATVLDRRALSDHAPVAATLRFG